MIYSVQDDTRDSPFVLRLLGIPHNSTIDAKIIDAMNDSEYNSKDIYFGSLARISDLKENPFTVTKGKRHSLSL